MGPGHNDSPCILLLQVYSCYHLTPKAEFGKLTFVTQDHCKQAPISKASSRKHCREAIILLYLPDMLQIYFLRNLILVLLLAFFFFFLEREMILSLIKLDKEHFQITNQRNVTSQQTFRSMFNSH